MEMQVNQIFTKNLVTVKSNESLAEADILMNNYSIRHLPVVDSEGFLVGIISKSDFIALKYVDSRLTKFLVKDFMSSPVKAVKKTSTIRQAAKMMIDKKINCLLVANQDEAVGILTSEDLIRLIAESNDFEAKMGDLDLSALADEGWISATLS